MRIVYKNFTITHKIILVLILIAILFQIPIILVRHFDNDEFEHLHGARNIYHGMVPYRDYFEHHTPFSHYFLALLYIFLADKIELIFLARFIMLVFTCAILYLTFRLAKLLYDLNVALLATLFLSYVLMFQRKTIEVRPDVPALIFWLLALFFFVSGIMAQDEHRKKRPKKYFLASGIMMASAILTTQKALFAAIGLFLVWICILFERQTESSLKERIALMVWFGLGFSIPFGITCLYFFMNNALGDFIYRNFIMNIQWKAGFTPHGLIRRLIIENTFFSLMSLLGLAIATFQLLKAKKRSYGSFVPLLSTYILIIGLFIIPIPQQQYYLLLLPLLAIYCGFIFNAFISYFSWEQFKKLRTKQSYLRFGLRLVSLVAVTIAFGLTLTYNKVNTLTFRNIPNFYLWVWLFLLPFLLWYYIKDNRQLFTVVLLIGTLIYPFVCMTKQISFRNNKNQLNEIRFILQNASSQDTIFDGWRGTGVFRNHAYYYYFLHSEIQMMLTPKELSEDIIEVLRNKKPKFIIYDKSIRALPEKVNNYIKDNYKPTGLGEIYVLENH